MEVLQRELEYHEKLYSGFAQAHFARPAVRALRQKIVERLLKLSGATRQSRVLSLGCGIGDTELLLAPQVGQLLGLDLSPAAVRQARQDAASLGIGNAEFQQASTLDLDEQFDCIIAVFFLHHLSDNDLADLPRQVARLLKPGGVFYSLDPNVRRLSGAVGRRLLPNLMKRYQTHDERELDPEQTAALFRRGGLACRHDMFDFGSSPVAGLLPGSRFCYSLARAADDLLLRVPPLRRLGSNFELIAELPGPHPVR
jgi:SAM-dependent methyltransferase